MPYWTLLFILASAVFYYRLGEAEYGGGLLLALVSVGLWLVGLFLLHAGVLINLLLQLGLFVGLCIWNLRSGKPD